MSHLKQLLSEHGISQTDLARILGRDKAVITNLFHGRRQLKAEEAMVIARHIGVPVSQILGVSEKGAQGFSEPSVLVPFQHEPLQVKGRSDIVKKDGKYYLEMEKKGYSPKTYALEVRDDSMSLSGIMPGDVIISEMDRPCKAGQIVVAQHYKGRGAETIIRKYTPPFLLPHSMTGSYKPYSLNEDEVRLVSPVLRLIRVF